MSKQPKSIFSSAVSDLVRAAAGGDTSKVADEDLDKYVADILLREAQVNKKKYNDIGVKAYLPNSGTPPSTLPKMNKRFLLNVVKATDSHNQALIRATEEQAQANRRRIEREERDRSRRRSRSPTSIAKRSRRSRSRSPYKDYERRERDRSSSPTSSPRRHQSVDTHPDNSSSSESSEDEKTVTFKGRGNITAGGPSAMDKYFSKSYDPSQDTGKVVDEDGWVDSHAHSKKKKSKSKKSKSKGKEESLRKHKHKKSKKEKTSDANHRSLNDGIVYSKGVREWDVAKVHNASKFS
ncbi:hypothetical protein K450DRAFT_253516 [Umbelopsis ramanniana AG]|uniref:Uncharacterized protein n=1 Tax=Umbelopsis ramanniana AG TaxID=1314678 RepID=A0AAD5E486_UMBRA|nr:uncharacterized protein K450DRAFT_253516 [Umbelopsis ramanniana AG]KAI8577071.1 hypothetical protein K450DRAFT_253516 [Umbelopsis ramanniana AG]